MELNCSFQDWGTVGDRGFWVESGFSCFPHVTQQSLPWLALKLCVFVCFFPWDCKWHPLSVVSFLFSCQQYPRCGSNKKRAAVVFHCTCSKCVCFLSFSEPNYQYLSCWFRRAAVLKFCPLFNLCADRLDNSVYFLHKMINMQVTRCLNILVMGHQISIKDSVMIFFVAFFLSSHFFIFVPANAPRLPWL